MLTNALFAPIFFTGFHDSELPERSRALLAALKSQDFQQIVAIDEIATGFGLESHLVDELLNVIAQTYGSEYGDILLSYLRYPSFQAVEILSTKTLERIHKMDKNFNSYLSILHSCGLEAKAALPYIRTILMKKKYIDADYFRAAHRVILLNLGDDLEKHRTNIIADLRDLRKSEAVISAMMSAPCNWITPDVLEEMIKLLKVSPVEEPDWRRIIHIAIAIGMLGEKAKTAEKDLRNLQGLAVKNQVLTGYPISLALARIDTKNQGDHLEYLLNNFQHYFINSGRGTVGISVDSTTALFNKELCLAISKKINTLDKGRMEIVATILEWYGRKARISLPRLLEMLQKEEETTRISILIKTVQRIAAPPDVKLLESVANKAKSENVVKGLTKTIEIIQKLKGFEKASFSSYSPVYLSELSLKIIKQDSSQE